MRLGDFERIIDIKNDLTIIPILNNETEGTEKYLGFLTLVYTMQYMQRMPWVKMLPG